MSIPHHAWDEGAKASESGYSRLTNPYTPAQARPDAAASARWFAGYDEADDGACYRCGTFPIRGACDCREAA